MKQLMKTNKELRKYFMDDVSKYIFDNRVIYSETNDVSCINNIIKLLPEYQLLVDQYKSKETFIFGAGKRGIFALKNYGLNVKGFIDNNEKKHGNRLEGVQIYNINEISQEANIFIANLKEWELIEQQLLERGFHIHQIDNDLRLEKYIEPRMYFDLPYLSRDKNEVFVDAGALDGDTSIGFTKWSRGVFDHIYCFEPDKQNYSVCVERLAFLKERVSVKNTGVWDKKGELSFDAGGFASSRISEKGTDRIKVMPLDKAIGEKRVTFIKMDIEGAEKQALKGSMSIIKENKPKLAISVYHCPDDIITIPNMILDYRDDYRFYLRHYSLHAYDTVLYAV